MTGGVRGGEEPFTGQEEHRGKKGVASRRKITIPSKMPVDRFLFRIGMQDK